MNQLEEWDIVPNDEDHERSKICQPLNRIIGSCCGGGGGGRIRVGGGVHFRNNRVGEAGTCSMRERGRLNFRDKCTI